MYKSSNAYNFEMFMPKEKKEPEAPRRDNIVKIPVRTERSRIEKGRKIRGMAGTVCMAALVITLLFVMIYSRVEISETQDRIEKRETELEQMRSEYTRMNMKIANQMSFQSVEEAAEALGMQKKTKSAVDYVTVEEEDRVDIKGKAQKK